MKVKGIVCLMISLLFLGGVIPGAVAQEEETVFSNAEMACALAELLGVQGDLAGQSELNEEERFQACLSLLPEGIQQMMATLFPAGPVTRGTVAGIMGLYMDEPQVESILGEGLGADLYGEGQAVAALEASGFKEAFEADPTLGFIAPDAHDFDSTDRESEQLQENFRIPLSGGQQ